MKALTDWIAAEAGIQPLRRLLTALGATVDQNATLAQLQVQMVNAVSLSAVNDSDIRRRVLDTVAGTAIPSEPADVERLLQAFGPLVQWAVTTILAHQQGQTP